MNTVIDIIKEVYPTLPALPGNYREQSALLTAVNEILARGGASAINEEALHDAILCIAPNTKFENSYRRADGRITVALRMILDPDLSDEEKCAAKVAIISALASYGFASDDWYALVELGSILKNAGFDYKAIGFRSMTSALQLIFGQQCRTAERVDGNGQSLKFIYIPIERHAVQALGPDVSASETQPAGQPVEWDRAAVCRLVCSIVRKAMPQGNGCYSMTRLVPVFTAAGFDFKKYGFKRVKDFLESCFGSDFRMEDRGEPEHPNIFALLPVDKYAADKGNIADRSERAVRTQPRTTAPSFGSRMEDAGRSTQKKKKKQSAFSKMMDFAFFKPQGTENGWNAAIRQLADMALKENWFYGTSDPGTYPILSNYLLMTFERLLAEDKAHENEPDWKPKIRIGANGNNDFFIDRWKDKTRTRVYPEKIAVFNTGLVDHLYEPIYAVFYSNLKEGGRNPWIFWSFVCSTDTARQILTRIFGTALPDAAHYYNTTLDLVYDVRKQIGSVNWDHIIDNCDRLPVDFLKDNGPDGFDYDRRDRAFYEQLATAIKSTPRIYNRIKNRIEDAMDYAVKRVRWNFKTAIPIYYPGRAQISLLLPLALVSEERIDIALVLEATGSDAYIAHTILTLKMAYTNARLITRPDSDWLMAESIAGNVPEPESDLEMV